MNRYCNFVSFCNRVILQRANAAGETALHYAAKFALPDVLRLLLGVGISGSGGVGWGALPTTVN